MRFLLLALVGTLCKLPGVLAFTLSRMTLPNVGQSGSALLATVETPTDTPTPTDTASPGIVYNQKAWESGFTTCQKEVCENIGSNLPKDLKGTYYRNGHAKFESGKEPVLHPFDADGMVTAVTFNDGQALFRNRFVRTQGYKTERKMKRILTRGAFGTAKKGGQLANIFSLSVRDTANTNAVYWAGRLLAMYESSLPHNLEPGTLRTLGPTTINGLLKRKQPFSAHPRICSSTNRLCNFSAQMGTGKSEMTVYEFDTKFNCVVQRSFTVPGFVFFHDFVVTKNYYIFTKLPVTFDPLPFVLGKKGPAECIAFDAKGDAEVILVPRDPSKEVQYVPVDGHFNFHYANGYEDEKGDIVFDSIRCSDMMLGTDMMARTQPIWLDLDFAKVAPPSRLERYTLKQGQGGQGGQGWSHTRTLLSQTQLDFPSVNPKVVGKPYRYVFASSGLDPLKPSPPQGVVKLDLGAVGGGGGGGVGSSGSGINGVVETRWNPAPHQFVGEVVFAAREGAAPDAPEDDGYLLSYLWDGLLQQSFLIIFDAADITKGPISKVPIPTNVPFALHGMYVPDLLFDEKEIKQKFTAFSALDGKNWNEMKGGFSGLGISYDYGI